MRNRITGLIILLSIGLIAVISCRKTTDTRLETPVKKVSKTYKPKAFQTDQRVELIREKAEAIQEMMVVHAVEENIPGMAYGIVVDDQLVLSSAAGLMNLEKGLPPSTTTAFRIASMSKSFTAMAILKLRDEGKLSLGDPASKYISQMNSLEYPTEDSPEITLNNLLTMTAGFPEDNPWGDRQLDEPDEMLLQLITSGMSFSAPPSYQFEYSNTGYAILGLIIKKVSGQSYQSYITQNILQPLGMNNTSWEIDEVKDEQLAIGYRWEDEQWKLEPMLHDGSYGAMGGLITTIEDFSKYVSFHLSAWPPRSEADAGPVKRSTIREMHTPQFTRLYPNATGFDGEACAIMAGYGFGLGITENCEGLLRVSHGGALPGFGSNYVFFPEYGIGMMAFGNLTYTSPWPYSRLAKLILTDDRLQTRKLPVSDILSKRQTQLTQFLQSWDTEQEGELLAENFYLDESKAHRMTKVKEILEKAGAIDSVSEINPFNQLRGNYKIYTTNGMVSVFFTLSPERDAKIQQLDVDFEKRE